MCKNLTFYKPSNATKQLKLQNCSSGRKLVVSTNWLPLFGFEADSRVKEELISKGKGIRISLVDKEEANTKKVYTRQYKSRKNNPIETLLDIRSQRLINDAFPEDTENVHILFSYGEIVITPISNRKNKATKQFKSSKNKFNTFLACSSGVDAVSLVRKGFSIETCLEYRSQEKRDKTDLTETGALNVLANVEVNYLINEDIMNIDINKIAALTKKSIHTVAHFSLQCDEFSNAKANSLKEMAIEDGSTSIDMVYDALRIIDQFNFPAVLIENVPNFFTGDAGKILISRLKRFGYEVFVNKFDAREFGGLTSRVRGYLFATMLPAKFEMPEGTKKNEIPVWELLDIDRRIEEGELRDVSSTKSLIAGVENGRARLLKRDSLYASTVLKSQNRQLKDSLYIFDEVRNKYFFPSNEVLAELMNIEMNFDAVSKTIMSEIIGQSIEVPLHEEILESIHKHLTESNMLLSGKLF